MSTSKIKEGQVIENYQGRFAKVVSVNEGRFGISAWVQKKEDADKDEKAVRFLNEFGLSQVLGKEEIGDATVAEETDGEKKEDAKKKK